MCVYFGFMLVSLTIGETSVSRFQRVAGPVDCNHCRVCDICIAFLCFLRCWCIKAVFNGAFFILAGVWNQKSSITIRRLGGTILEPRQGSKPWYVIMWILLNVTCWCSYCWCFPVVQMLVLLIQIRIYSCLVELKLWYFERSPDPSIFQYVTFLHFHVLLWF